MNELVKNTQSDNSLFGTVLSPEMMKPCSWSTAFLLQQDAEHFIIPRQGDIPKDKGKEAAAALFAFFCIQKEG
ncbi:hypothetical protein KIH86_00205 [Paenibacillus sp. HN-1]|uniref:hypothetical protein n=1 Tax=Paenibacillus sp. CGMCC 1.18879 TaxID=2834466 RepID=UPI001CA8DFBB|nr:hypothetical protein [Paenibacillus sp. CGMCC 1.18879]MBY9082136.1 hypothetical protein [Paenibacillus sp. CGMCC 1.18879]MBY9082668.1 hypothetical protein [Paenibacillus sinensis]